MFFRGNTLKLDFILRKCIFEILGTFVVENMQVRGMGLAHKQLVSGLPSLADTSGLPSRNGNGVNGVGVLVVEYKNIIVTATGWDVEATSLIGIGLEKGLVGKEYDGNLMSAGRKQGSDIDVGVRSEGFGERSKPSGTNVLGFLILVAERSSNRFRKMFADKLRSKARESSELAATNSS